MIGARIQAGIDKYGTGSFLGTKIYAFEVDGFGNQIFIDDANLPNLLGIPFYHYPDQLGLYNATRAFSLSKFDVDWVYSANSTLQGLGSQHHSFGLRPNPGPQCTGK